MKKLLLISLLFAQTYSIASDNFPFDTLEKEKTHQCKGYPDCNKTFKSYSGLIRHKAAKHEGATYPCEYHNCNEIFKSPSGLSDHVAVIHEDATYPCTYFGCNEKFKNRYGLWSHKKKHESEESEIYPCTYFDCNEKFKNRSNLLNHVAVIHKSETYPCTYFGCNETFKSPSGLWYHKKKHESKDRDKDTNEGATVKRKKKTPQESVAYSTSTITKAPSSSILKNNQDVLNSNDLYQQKNKDKNEYTEDRNKTYDCEHLGCSKTFATPGGLGYHIRTEHNENEMYQCPYSHCNEICIAPSGLWNHMKKHEDKMHECTYPFCSKTFATPDELSHHTRTEHAEKQSLEDDDEEDDDLRKNNVVHVEKKPFSCNQCESSYSRVDALEKHIKAIHEGIRYQCSTCEYISSDQSNMKRHLKHNAHAKMITTNISLLDK